MSIEEFNLFIAEQELIGNSVVIEKGGEVEVLLGDEIFQLISYIPFICEIKETNEEIILFLKDKQIIKIREF